MDAMSNQLELKITNAAKAQIKKFLLENAGIDHPIPGLLLGRQNEEVEKHWTVGAYSQDQITNLVQIYLTKGLVLLYEADGIELCVPQTHLVVQLGGKTLDYQEGHYVVF